MKRLLTIICSLLVVLAFASVTLATDISEKKVQKIPPNSKQGKQAPRERDANLKLTDTKAQNTDGKGKEEKKETKDSKKGKKVEKKEEQKKSDDKK